MAQTPTEWMEREVVELHFQVLKTQLILQEIVKRNSTLETLDEAEIRRVEDQALELLNRKFPGMSIQRNSHL